VVSLPSPLARALVEHQAAQAVERVHAANLWQDDGWVFAQPTGKPVDPRADYGEWKELLVVAGVREARLHDARHTAATFLLVLGVSDRAAMDVMGWSKADMAKRYMHVPDELRQRIADQLSQLLWSQHGDDDGTRG
jgi:integrase